MIVYLQIFATMTLASSSQVLNNTFYYLETVSNSILVADVFREFNLTRKVRPVVQCGVGCSMVNHCSGIEVCGGVSCRLWNGSFTSDTAINATKTCRRYKKVSIHLMIDDFAIISFSPFLHFFTRG